MSPEILTELKSAVRGNLAASSLPDVINCAGIFNPDFAFLFESSTRLPPIYNSFALIPFLLPDLSTTSKSPLLLSLLNFVSPRLNESSEGSIVIEPVPIVNIPVTLASPVTTKSSPKVVAPPTCNLDTVVIPAERSLTPAPATIGPLKVDAVTTPANTAAPEL